MDLITTPQNSDERRRHIRRRVSSIVYVKLADGNGGILLNLGLGGLSFQAVAGIRPEQNLVLSFGFFDTNETITIAGRVAWLGPTRKEVGVCFQDVPGDTEESIAKWMAGHETTSDATELDVVDSPMTAPAVAIEILPPQPASVSSEDGVSLNLPSPKGHLPSDSLLGRSARSGLRKFNSALTVDDPPVMDASLHPLPLNPVPANEYFVGSSAEVDRTEVLPESVQVTSQVFPQNRSRYSDAWFPTGPVSTNSPTAVPTVETGVRKTQRDRVLIFAGVASFIGILVLIFMIGSTERRPNDAGSSEAATPAPTYSAPGGGTQNIVTPAPSPVLRPPAVRRPTQGTWLSALKGILGSTDDRGELDPAAIGITVWTDKRSGFYYCLDSPYFAKLQPGSSVTQGAALQNGYQPKLGSYCH